MSSNSLLFTMMPTEVVGRGGRAEGGGIHDEFSQ